MNITIVCDVLGEANNGTTIAALNLIDSLKRKGHNVRVVCGDESRIGQEGYYVVKSINLGPLNSYVKKNGVSLSRPDKKILRQAISGADVVHCMMPFALSRAAMKVSRQMGIPVTAGFHVQAENFTSHIFMMNSRLANKLTYKNFYRTFYRHCACVHYPTDFIRSVFEDQTGPTNHYVISNGVNKRFKPMSINKPTELADKFVILFTGRYSKEKSHDLLIDAVSLSKYSDRIQLIFAGAGPRAEHIDEYSKKLPLKPICRFFSREELVKILNFTDLYVHPAEVEIEAISCLEAIACGDVPVINNSPRCATKSFALTDKNLFEFNDSSDLAKKIDYWIEHPREKAECSIKYRDFAKQFDFDTCMDKMEGMLKDAAAM